MTRRFLAYFLIWMLIAVPTLSYAWFPIVGGVANTIIATKAGQVLSKKGARWVKHQYESGKLSEGLQWLLVMCGSYQDFTGDTCVDVGRKAYDILTKDGWQTEQTDNGIEIYKVVVECGYTGYPRDALYDTFELACNSFLSHEKKYFKQDSVVIEQNSLGQKTCFVKSTSTINGSKNKSAVGIKQICNDDRHRRYLTSDDIWNMIQDPSNGFNDQDITNILKYDYSDKSVTINNHTYNGGDIKFSFDPNVNINRDGDGTDGKPGWGLEIDPTFAPKLVPIIVNPNIKIGLPDINYNNCTANAQGAIVNCDKLERKYNIDIDGDGKIGNEDPTCPDGYTLKDDKCVKVDPKPPSDEPKDPKDPKPPATKDPQLPEQKPWVCSTSSLTQKICDWIDFTKEEPAIPADDPIIPIDKTKDIELDKNILTFNKSCPAPQSFSFNMLGKTHSNQFDFKPFCDVATAIKPIILAVGGLVSIYILTGTPRPSDD